MCACIRRKKAQLFPTAVLCVYLYSLWHGHGLKVGGGIDLLEKSLKKRKEEKNRRRRPPYVTVAPGSCAFRYTHIDRGRTVGQQYTTLLRDISLHVLSSCLSVSLFLHVHEREKERKIRKSRSLLSYLN